jgi:hypothetical protein
MTLRPLALSLFLAISAIAAGACGGDDTAETLCTPGEEVFCKCRGGFEGTKTCLDDGQSFGECTTPDGECPTIEETTSSTSSSSLCTAGEEIFCTCDDGTDGSKRCADDGQSYGDCTTPNGPCGAGMGDKLLYEPCVSGSECASGTCSGGMCTRTCASYVECVDEPNMIFGDCVDFGGGNTLCGPYCFTQENCAAYGGASQCGGTSALDDPMLSFAACGDWGGTPKGYPAGTPCDEVAGEILFLGDNVVQSTCDLGLDGVQNVCLFGECAKACYEAADCPAMDCTSNGMAPGCCSSDPDCN